MYVTVDDLEAATERARAAGGTVIAEPFQVFDVGRMSCIQDPQGAMLRLWYPLEHAGAGVMMEPGALCWFELATTDPESAVAFYKSVLQVDIDRDENVAEFSYWVMKVGDQMVGGIIQIGEDWGPVPPNWGVYFGVNDVDAIAGKAKELGGGVIVEPRDLMDFARFSVLTDAEGAAFTVIRLNEW